MSPLRAPSEHDGLPALIAGERRWSHAELWGAADTLAAAMAAAPPGGAPRGLVLAFCRNSPGTVLGYLAARRAGQAVAMLDAGLDPARRQALVAAYEPEWILDAAPAAGATVVLPVLDAFLSRLPGAGGGPLHPELALLLSTSGTTGSPKLVRLSQAAVVANARAIAQALALGPEERAIASLPLHYSYGLSLLHSHLVAGGALVLSEEGPLQRGFWRSFDEARCTSFAGVPYSYQLLLRIGVEGMSLPSLRTMTQAGGRLHPDLVRRLAAWLHARGADLRLMYGQTEATARICVSPPGAALTAPEAAGRVIPGGSLLVDAGQGPSPQPHLQGELVYRGPNVMMGYARSRADLGRGDELRGELYTGDLGEVDEEGLLTITGRSSRIGKVFGLRLDLDEVEARLQARGPTAVVAGEDWLDLYCEWGDEAEHRAAARELAAALRVHHDALHFRRIEALPRGRTGKVDYQVLRGQP